MTDEQKPNAASLGWKIEKSFSPYRNETFSLAVDKISIRDGNETEYGYLKRAQAVVIVPLTRDGQVVMVRQYRYPIDDWCLEVPAGGTHDTGDETLREVARKELHEEVGATATRLSYVDYFYSAPALSDEKCHVFLAEGLELIEKPQTESTENISVTLFEADQALELARSGKMKNSPCALALLLCESALRERGYI